MEKKRWGAHRALTSITQYSRLFGLSAYWILHSPTTPRWRMTCTRTRKRAPSDQSARTRPRAGTHLERGGAQHVVLVVGERLGGRDDDGVAGVRPERVEVLHVAADDRVLRARGHVRSRRVSVKSA